MLVAAALACFVAAQEDPHERLYARLLEESKRLAEHADTARAEAARSEETAVQWQESRLRSYLRLLGPMPARTPLETTIVGELEADGYRIERLHFQSRPGHHVTANLYVPDGEGPFPGVAVPCGHSDNGKAYESYQKACALLALNGFVALIYDPVGQGERHQLVLDRHGTTEHELLNCAGVLVGEPLAKHELWDGVRAIDVLLAQPELGGRKTVGVAGNSGGGTQTVYLTGWDERVAAATPACYVMERQRLFETLGPQDGCQWLPGEGAVGLDPIDYLALRAPDPIRVLAAERDFFEFASTRAAVESAAPFWRALGEVGDFDLVSTDHEHGWSRPLREACVQWMRMAFYGDDDPVHEPDLRVFPDEALRVTSTGQVTTEFEDERTVTDFLVERAVALRGSREGLTRGEMLAQLLNRELGLTHGAVVSRESVLEGRRVRIGTLGDMTSFVQLESGEPGGDRVTLVLDDRGKLADPTLLLARADAGRQVVSVDLPGYGETADRGAGAKYHNPEHRTATLSMYVGSSLLGQRVSAVISLIRELELMHHDIELIGMGRAGVTALHVAYLHPDVKKVELRNTIRSWEQDVVADPAAPGRLGNVVPGVLAHWDLPDLEAALGDRVWRRDD